MRSFVFGVLAVFLALCVGCADSRIPPVVQAKAARLTPPRVAFHWNAHTKALTVTTSALALTIKDAAVVSLEDLRSGVRFSKDPGWAKLRESSVGFVTTSGRAASVQKLATLPRVRHRPSAASHVVFTQRSAMDGELAYEQLGESAPDDSITVRIRAEENGELSLMVEGRVVSGSAPTEVDLPFVGLTPSAVIAGSGERFARADPPDTARCERVANNMYSPAVGVIEGPRGVVGMWPEPTSYGYDDLLIKHTPASDEVIPQVNLGIGGKDPATLAEPGVSRTSWWRVAALPTWLDVAKRYRAYFERKSGAKPLWKQEPVWVRNIHAVMMNRLNTTDPAKAEEYYAELARKFDPRKLLLFYWDANNIVLFSDPTYLRKFQRPSFAEVAALRRHGFRWIGYHPYNLIYSPSGMEHQLASERARGFGVPEGYVFTPDYAGPPSSDGFYAYWRPVAAGFYGPLDGDTAKFWILHPGAKTTRDYLARNVGDYCRAHGMSGAYLDTLGNDNAGQYLVNAPSDRRIMAGLDSRNGAALACRAIKKANPGLALMSEVNSPWTVAQTFYTWEGRKHLTAPSPPHLNHPLRAACWGSYVWTKSESPDALALLAGLPEVRLADDWSVARAKLYMDENLFNALPKKWDPDALAYYRGRDAWFEYRKMPWGEAYVELGARGRQVKLGRFMNQTESPLAEPVRIQNWVAYRNNRPIGLDPKRIYEFIAEPPSAKGGVRVTDLPSGAYVSSLHQATDYSVIALGSRSASRTGTVTVSFHQRCFRVSDAREELGGPFEAGAVAQFTTRIPGGFVFVWREPKRSREAWLMEKPAAVGHVTANGIPYSYWTYDAAIRVHASTPKSRVLEVGLGMHGGYADQWADVPARRGVMLRFDTALAASAKPRSRQKLVAVAVHIDGSEVWQKVLHAGAGWQPQEVDLTPYAGRRVLITVSAENMDSTGLVPNVPGQPVRFRNLRITGHGSKPGAPSSSSR